MKRFRITLLVICLLLGWLGYSDLSLLLRNPEPQQLSIDELIAQGPAREWVSISGGQQDLLQAINMSGTIEVGSFLVPLKSSPEAPEVNVWFETREPQIIELLKTYYFKLETEQQRQQFLKDNAELLTLQRNVTGMTADNLIADSNHKKLTELLEEMQLTVPENVIFISQGKKPTSLRGFFFVAMSMIGLIKLALMFRPSKSAS